VKEVLIVFAGGGLGAVARYWLSGVVYKFASTQFPYGTMTVNVLGCFLIGFLMSLFADRFLINPGLRLFLTLGFLGGFTTFSTLSYETMELFRAGNSVGGIGNVLITTIGCLAATWVGAIIGKQV
jgi:CrcB protein